MIGLGTIINCAGVVVGGVLGLLFGKFLKENVREILITTSGVAVIMVGIAGALREMFTLSDGTLETRGGLCLILCLVLGGFIGELLSIEKHFEDFGEFLKRKSGSSGDNNFVEGFVVSSMTISIGAMAVIGPFNDALYGDLNVLIAKTILDTVMIFSMSSAKGKGCVFSVIPVAVIQGFFTLAAKLLEPVMTAAALSNINLVGNTIIACIGINLVFGKKVRVANLLPALILAVLASFIPYLN